MSGSNQEKIKPHSKLVCYITKIKGEFIMGVEVQEGGVRQPLNRIAEIGSRWGIPFKNLDRALSLRMVQNTEAGIDVLDIKGKDSSQIPAKALTYVPDIGVHALHALMPDPWSPRLEGAARAMSLPITTQEALEGARMTRNAEDGFRAGRVLIVKGPGQYGIVAIGKDAGRALDNMDHAISVLTAMLGNDRRI